ncbi:hypothetical protein ACHAQE_002557, partial [Botrytis cinerea]
KITTHQAEVHGRRVSAHDRSIENEGVEWLMDEPELGERFESLRRSAILDLDEFIRFQRQHRARALAQDLEGKANLVMGASSSSTIPSWASSQGFGDHSRTASRRRAEQNVFEIIWRATANVERISFLRAILLAGLGVSSVWSVYRSLRFGLILWCKQSLRALLKKLDSTDINEEDSD